MSTIDNVAFRSLWRQILVEIRIVECELDKFYTLLTPYGHAHPINYCRHIVVRSRMLQALGFHTTKTIGGCSLDDLEYVSRTIEEIKVQTDANVQSMNAWIKHNAEKNNIKCCTMTSDSVEELIIQWSRDVIGRYAHIAQAYMMELNASDPSRGLLVFKDVSTMPKTFKKCFPVLDTWNMKQSEIYEENEKTMDWDTSGTPSHAMSTVTRSVDEPTKSRDSMVSIHNTTTVSISPETVCTESTVKKRKLSLSTSVVDAVGEFDDEMTDME